MQKLIILRVLIYFLTPWIDTELLQIKLPPERNPICILKYLLIFLIHI